MSMQKLAEQMAEVAKTARELADAQVSSAHAHEDPTEPREPETPVVTYPDPEDTPEMKHARRELEKFSAAKILSEEGDIKDWNEAEDLISWRNKFGTRMYGSDTKNMTAYTVRPSRLGMWPIDATSSHAAGSNTPKGRELAVRLKNSQACYDAAQKLKSRDLDRTLMKFLAMGDLDAYAEYVDVWHNFWQIYVEKWPRSQYAPKPWPIV